MKGRGGPSPPAGKAAAGGGLESAPACYLVRPGATGDRRRRPATKAERRRLAQPKFAETYLGRCSNVLRVLRRTSVAAGVDGLGRSGGQNLGS